MLCERLGHRWRYQGSRVWACLRCALTRTRQTGRTKGQRDDLSPAQIDALFRLAQLRQRAARRQAG